MSIDIVIVFVFFAGPIKGYSPGGRVNNFGYHDLPKQTGTDETGRNGPKRTYENNETDFYGYRNGPERTSVGTETDRNRLQLTPKRTSIGIRKCRMGYNRNNPNKSMYILVGRYVGR